MNSFCSFINKGYIVIVIFFIGFVSNVNAAIEPIGVISVLIGDATIKRAQQKLDAKTGLKVFENDLVKTSKASRIQILLNDQTAVNLGQNAEIRLDDFVQSGDEPKVSLTVAKGTFRFISGKIANKRPGNVNVKTPLAIIGVRGTEYIGRVGLKDIADNSALRTDVTLLSGVIVVENEFDQQVISKPGFAVTIQPSGAITDPIRVNEQDLDSRLKSVSTDEEDVKKEESNSNEEQSSVRENSDANEDSSSDGPAGESERNDGQEPSGQAANEDTNSGDQPARENTADSSETIATSSERDEQNSSVEVESSDQNNTTNPNIQGSNFGEEPSTNAPNSSALTDDRNASSQVVLTDQATSIDNQQLQIGDTSLPEPSTSLIPNGDISREPVVATDVNADTNIRLDNDFSFVSDDAPLPMSTFDTAASGYQSPMTTSNPLNNESRPSETLATATEIVTNDNLSEVRSSTNSAPSISGFSDATNSVYPTRTQISENQRFVGTVSATDADSNSLTYSILSNGSADEDLFIINDDGELSFLIPPNFESPSDVNSDNTYAVGVSVSDGTAVDIETFTIEVGNKPLGDALDFNASIGPVDENQISLLSDWGTFFELAQDGLFSFQNISMPNDGSCGFGTVCISGASFSGSYNSRLRLVDVSVQGDFSSTADSSPTGSFSASWTDHSITEFSQGGFAPGTASFVTSSTFASIVGEGGAELDANDSFSITPVTGSNFLLTSEFQINNDSRNANIPYSALGRIGLYEFDQSSEEIGSATTNSFLGQPTITDP